MSKTIEIAKELKQELDQLPLFQEYKKLREQVEASEEIAKLKEDIARASVAKDYKLHKVLLDRYNSHPLIVNFNIIEEEVASYLKEISNIVNKK